MAEFKLGRLKFVWKGTWATATAYVKDDVVRYGNSTYICTIGHTSAASINTDINVSPSRWNKMSEGQTWRGDWTTSTAFYAGEIVKYGGNLYTCSTGHTSAATASLGLEQNSADWNLYLTGIDFKGDWSTSTRYKLNDVVQYGATNYICLTYHTSAATATLGLEQDQSKWDVYSTSVDYKGTWATTTRYKVNDIVKYGAGLWICVAAHSSGANFSGDTAYWNQFVEGFEYESDWSNVTIYQPGDVVRYGGNQYIAKTVHSASNPLTGTTNWDLFSENFKFQSTWSITTSYKIGEIVKVGGNLFIATTDAPSIQTTLQSTDSGTNYFQAVSTTDVVAGMVVRFTGSAFGNVNISGTYYVKQVINATQFTISTTPGGAAFTPVTASSLTNTVTFAPKPPNASYWTALSEGLNWRGSWTDDTEYAQNDLVRYGANTYICKLAHRSEGDDGSTVGATGGGQVQSRPDQDATSTYWDLFNVGTETSVMNTKGDMVYYGTSGPVRLPVGTEGQVLRVSSNSTPEWVSWGMSDNIYYVGTNGQDLPFPTYGGTIDKPWKSVRYAAQQIERGCMNPEARRLLEMNRIFIQKEVCEWIEYQVTNNVSPFTTGFTFARDRCERDIGWVIDGLVYDVTHGGNVRSRGAALAYVNALYPGENGTYTRLAAERLQDIACYNYMVTLIQKVLLNQAPTVNYQVTNGDNSTAIVSQYIDTAYTAETGVYEKCVSLVGIITQALTDQSTANIPERNPANNTINVRTGEYYETLPIIVPECTVVIGDELRSTRVSPAGSLINLSDTFYTVSTLSRLRTVAGQIVQGINVTESTGNTASQSSVWPLAPASTAVEVEKLVGVMQHKIDQIANTAHMRSYTLPYLFNTVSYLNGYGDARTLIIENKEFIKEEIAKFTDVNYPSVKYSRTKCKRDVGYIVDAIVYDLTYTGTTQSLNAGLAYFDGPGSSLLIDSTELAATIAAYGRLKTILQQIVQNISVTVSTGNTQIQFRDSTLFPNGGNTTGFVGSCIDIITGILSAGSTNGRPNFTVTSITGNNTFNTAASHGLAAGDLVIPRTTANGVTADTRYYVLTTTTTSFTVSLSYAGSGVGGLTNGTGLTIVFDYEDRPTINNNNNPSPSLTTAYTALSAAVGTIVTNMSNYIAAKYPSLTYNTAKCNRDVRIILDAVGYDFQFNTNVQTIAAAYSYLRSSASDVFSLGQKTATRDAFQYVKEQAKSNVGGDTTSQNRIETLMNTLDEIVFGATSEGLTCGQSDPNFDYAILQLEKNRDYIVSEISAYMDSTFSVPVNSYNATTGTFTLGGNGSWLKRNAAVKFVGTAFSGITTNITYYVQRINSSLTEFSIAATRDATTPLTGSFTTGSGSMTLKLVFNSELCLRDVNEMLDALKFDLRYTGNYKSVLAARYYANAVRGSKEEDMYYLRNETGLRNQTMFGLTGDLLAPNAYGTSRVSAGAYASLDPGAGPHDYHSWIISRSPYIQNCTTFGYAAIGQKIDGSLHNGGNDSMVSNDFTQVISDGIGCWVTNNARAELVSVFTYYSHVGYLSENGGRIRGTNGNNSYGDFGSVAEGFDSTETAITAVVDNRKFTADVGSVLTDGINQLWTYEFSNAGTDYTYATWSIGGTGASVAVEQDEFRDDGVFQVRLLDNVDDSTNAPEIAGNFGGFGYLSNANTAQGGTLTNITIAATDSEVSSAYVGMKILLTAGSGAGQYAIISVYNSGLKLATVIKESDGSSGWDHIVPGTTLVSPDASTTYVIEPALSFTSPTFSSTARTLATSLTYVNCEWASTTAYYSAVSATGGSGSGATFNIVRRGPKYLVITINSAGNNYVIGNTLTVAGANLGGATPDNNITIKVTSVNTTSGAIIQFESSGTGQGGYFVALASGTQNINTSLDGITWSSPSATALPSASNWSWMANGDITVSETAGSFVNGRLYQITSVGNTIWTNIGAANNLLGTYFVYNNYTGAGYTGSTGTAKPIATSLVAVSDSTTVNAYSLNGGQTWTAGGALPAAFASGSAGTYVAYGIQSTNGRWVVIRNGITGTGFSTNGGITWTSGGNLPSAATWTGLAYGKGKFVAVASGGTTAAYSSDGGATWTAATLPSSSNWTSVAYGNNRFVAISATTGTAAAYSLDGITWVASTLPASATWTNISYGQGVFLAVSQSTQAASSEDGIRWASRTMSTAANGFSSSTFGNPNKTGVWVSVQRSTAGTVASSSNLGATTRARAYVANKKIFAVRILEPGSGYSVAPTMTITDPNNTYEAPFAVRIGKGALANPSFRNRGTGYGSATAQLDTGDGYGDNFQYGSYIAVKNLTAIPAAGANVVLSSQPNFVYKLVQVLSQSGTDSGSIGAFLQISPDLSLYNAPAHETAVTTRIRYSQVRLTGHDFLDIGTGNFDETNYPGGIPDNAPSQSRETVDNNGGRVFYTSTDQDGNFRVGELFTIEQSTGIATLNADAFNIAGLAELTLGSVTLGGSSATIVEFSTDPFFTANSDQIVPTQRAIRTYIASQIGGGGASLNVNSVVAGFIEISNNQITTTSGAPIQMKANFNFSAGVTGYPLAWNYFLL